MTIDVPAGEMYLGTDDSDQPTFYDASNLTTHGVIVGMTGSGKTGLGMIMLEEALLAGVPTLIIDPKGDMGNLLLTFPELAASDFAPWVPDGDDPAAVADLWKSGLARSGIEPSRIGELRSKTKMTIYTPGSSAGVPLNVIGSMEAPVGDDAHDPAAFEESKHDEIEGLVSSLLGLIDVQSDPLSGREHILMANIIDHFWSRGTSVSIESLIQSVMQPPFRKLGVMQLDTLFPEADRMKLAMKLNGLAASPAFAAWSEGVPLDIDEMLFQPNGDPRAAVVNIHHLSDEERQFVVTLLLSKVVTWMRSQQGSDDLRVLIYMDEVFGFVPPTAMPPSKKPILTILKQARAFGVGLVLSTQNPVDIDYKAISNAGTWMIGRLQTERDKARLLEGMERSDGEVDIRDLDATISSLDKREFVLHSTRGVPQQFSTRWAMSYLPGPLTRSQIGQLTEGQTPTAAASTSAPTATAAPAPAEPVLADNESTVAPPVAKGIDVRYVRADAPWADDVGHSPTATRVTPALAVRMHLLYDETKADLRHEVEWEGIVRIDDDRIDPEDALEVDFDERDFDRDAAGELVYVLPDAPIDKSTFFTQTKTAFKDHLYRHESLQLFHNPELKAYSRVGEDEAAFKARCEDLADDRADEQVDKLRDALLKKEDRLAGDLAKLEDRIREIEFEKESSRNDAIAGVALDVLGGLLGGRRRSRSAGRSILRGRKATGKAEQRLATAENRYAEKLSDLNELRDEVEDDINQIVFEWQDKAHEITSYEVPLEKADIAVDDIALIWIGED